MCNLYSITKNQDAIRRLFGVTKDSAGNLPLLPGVFRRLSRTGGA
jgi:hypothetical protein